MKTSTNQYRVVFFGLLLALVGACGLPEDRSGAIVSDVPSLEATAWPENTRDILIRAESGESDVLLLTHQDEADARVDRADGIRGNDFHGAVYRYDPVDEQFEVVEVGAWEDGAGEPAVCKPTGSFPWKIRSTRLMLKEKSIEVAGKAAMGVFTAPSSAVAAVLSADGHLPFFLIPGATALGRSGQHYHELFSDVDGTRIGEPLRLPLGGIGENPPQACWSPDEKYVIYWEDKSDGFATISVVRVDDDLPKRKEE